MLGGKGAFEFDETIAHLFDKPKVVDINKLVRPALAGEKEIENLFVIPTDYQLSRIIETSLTKINRERILERALNKLEQDFDVILLDTPPNLSLTTLNAIQASNLLLITVDSGAFSLDGIAPLLEAAEEVLDDFEYRVLRNEVDSRNTIINDFIDGELGVISQNLLKTQIRRCEDVGKANACSLPVRLFKKGSIVNNDYRALATELKSILSI
ncbi:sporulation initiation inhibitor protein Soj [Vibrio astriarenae]|nr:sporulation initiation inhibitor protein Soj [Vibrio sp. C7]